MVAASLPLASCGRPLDLFRFGYTSDLTNATALVGVESGRFAQAGQVPVRALVFAAGPLAVEPLLTRDLDAAYLDPISAISLFLRSKGRYVIVAGAATGGAALVASRQSKARVAEDLSSAKVATPHHGNTQDVAARAYFGGLGFISYEQGGKFRMTSMPNTTLLSAMKTEDLAAAWTVEPWVSQLIEESKATLILDEASLWGVAPATAPYPTAVLVVRKALLRQHPDVVDDFLRRHVETTDWINAHPTEAQALAHALLAKLTSAPLSPAVIGKAWSRVRLTVDLPRDALARQADQAARVGFFGFEPIDMAKLIDEKPMKRATNPQPGS